MKAQGPSNCWIWSGGWLHGWTGIWPDLAKNGSFWGQKIDFFHNISELGPGSGPGGCRGRVGEKVRHPPNTESKDSIAHLEKIDTIEAL